MSASRPTDSERLGGRFGVLRLRDFRNVFIAQTVSTFGDGITPVALTFAVLDLTGSGTDLGLVLAAQVLPLMALALVGGVWADRLPRNLVMVASDLIRAAVQLTGAFLLLTGSAQVWQLALLAAVHGSAEAFFRPAAGALVPQIVPVARLRQANALMGMSDNFGWMVGPAMAGTLVALIGAGGAIAVDGVTFLVSAAFLATLRVPAVKQAGARAAGFLSEFRQGWWEVTSRRWLWVMLLRVALVLCFVVAPFQVLGPLGLREQGLSTGEAATAWGWIQAAFSAGMIGGALFAIRYRPRRPMVTVSLMGATALVSPLTLALGGGPTALDRHARPPRRGHRRPRHRVEHRPADGGRGRGPRASRRVGLDGVAVAVAGGAGAGRPARPEHRRDQRLVAVVRARHRRGLLGVRRARHLADALADEPADGRRRRDLRQVAVSQTRGSGAMPPGRRGPAQALRLPQPL